MKEEEDSHWEPTVMDPCTRIDIVGHYRESRVMVLYSGMRWVEVRNTTAFLAMSVKVKSSRLTAQSAAC